MHPQSIFKNEIDINKYEEIKPIGHGRFGKVYKVKEKGTDIIYALKELKYDDDDETFKENIDREITIMMSTNHPTIIKFIGCTFPNSSSSTISILMQYAENGSLSNVLLKMKKNPNEFTNTIRQIILIGIARGMKYLHDHNIIHRDLKSANILLDKNYHPLISDFGTSKYFDSKKELEQSGSVGTPFYMAPEVLIEISNNKFKYDRRADVYSFSILMFEVVTNASIIIEEKNPLNFIRKVVDEDYRLPFPKTFSNKPIKELIKKCWSRNPDDRPSFDEIYRKLAYGYGTDDEIDDSGDVKKPFYLDGVNENDIKSYISDISKKTDKIEELIFENEKLNEKIQNLKSQMKSTTSKKRKMKEDLSNQIKELNKENAELKKNNERLLADNESEKRTLTFDNRAISKKIKDLEADKENLSNQIKELKTRNDQLLNAEQELNTQNEELNNENAELKKKNSDLEKNNEQLLADNESEKANNIDLSNKKRILNFDIRAMSKKIKDLEADKGKLSNQIKELKTKNEQLNVNNAKRAVSLEEEKRNSMNNIQILHTFKQNITIKQFNSLSLQSQKIITSLIVSIPDFNQNSFFVKLDEFLFNLIKYGELKERKCLEIFSDDKGQNLVNLKNEYPIQLFSDTTEFLYQKEAFKSTDFIDQLKKFNEISIEIKYPSNDFEAIYKTVLSMKNENLDNKQLEIGIFLSGTSDIKSDFQCDKNIESVRFDSNVKSIKMKAFSDCKSLKRIIIPSTTESIDDFAFSKCSSLKQIEFENNSFLSVLKKSVFNECKSLTQILIPDTVRIIERNCFINCSSLKIIRIPSSITKINNNAFEGCSSLKEVTFSKTIQLDIIHLKTVNLLKKLNLNHLQN